MIVPRPLSRAGAALALALATALSGCATIYEFLPVPPAFSLRWLWTSKKPGPLPELKPTATAAVNWQSPVGKAVPAQPVVLPDALYTASVDGSITRLDPATGRQVWRIAAGKGLSAGVGADESIVVVGTDKGDVLAFDPRTASRSGRHESRRKWSRRRAWSTASWWCSRATATCMRLRHPTAARSGSTSASPPR